jgi:hypothetical protein
MAGKFKRKVLGPELVAQTVLDYLEAQKSSQNGFYFTSKQIGDPFPNRVYEIKIRQKRLWFFKSFSRPVAEIHTEGRSVQKTVSYDHVILPPEKLEELAKTVFE